MIESKAVAPLLPRPVPNPEQFCYEDGNPSPRVKVLVLSANLPVASETSVASLKGGGE